MRQLPEWPSSNKRWDTHTINCIVCLLKQSSLELLRALGPRYMRTVCWLWARSFRYPGWASRGSWLTTLGTVVFCAEFWGLKRRWQRNCCKRPNGLSPRSQSPHSSLRRATFARCLLDCSRDTVLQYHNLRSGAQVSRTSCSVVAGKIVRAWKWLLVVISMR